MTEPAVRSFRDYLTRIRHVVETATPAAAWRFCGWAIKRFPAEFGDDVWDGLTAAELERFREMLRGIEAAAAAGVPLPADRAAALENHLLAFGPEDDRAKEVVHPDAIEFRSAVETTLRYCQTRDLDEVCRMSEHLINSLDYNLDRPADYGLENMFAFPPMQRELEAHEKALAAGNHT